jgi:hypothetical protein
MKLLMNGVLAGLFAVSGLANSAEGVGPVVADAKQILVSGNGHKRDFPCNGRHLVVEGSDHVVTTTGICASADIGGANNTVNVEIAPKGKLIVGGTQQKVQWRSAGEPDQDLSGIDNQVRRVK